MIETRGLTKVFLDKKRGKIRAVDKVSFTSKPGQIYGLLGANGAGKSSLARAISGLVTPCGGQVSFAGNDISRRSPHRIPRRCASHPRPRRYGMGGTLTPSPYKCPMSPAIPEAA